MAEPALIAGASLVVVSHQGGDRLQRCLDSLEAQSTLPSEILLVLSRGGGVPMPARLPAGCPLRLVHCSSDLHYGAAVNRGAARARARWLLVLNDDTVAHPQMVGALLAAAAAGGPGLYQPRILLAGSPGQLDNAGHLLFPDGHNQPRGRACSDGPRWDREGSLGAVSGAAFLAPRDLFLELGGFDEDLGAFGEDLDLSLRLVRRGFPLVYVPAAGIEHELGASYGRAGHRKIYLVERNRLRAAARSLPWSALLGAPAWTGLRWSIMATAAAAGRGWGGQLPRGAALAAVAGALAGLRHLPQALRKRSDDARDWERGERAMLGHLWTHRARVRDFF